MRVSIWRKLIVYRPLTTADGLWSKSRFKLANGATAVNVGGEEDLDERGSSDLSDGSWESFIEDENPFSMSTMTLDAGGVGSIVSDRIQATGAKG